MSKRKIPISGHCFIVELYKNTADNSTKIGIKYNVSSSTVCRILRINIDNKEYKRLKGKKISQGLKRSLSKS